MAMSEYTVNISLTGCSIPYPDGTLHQDGDTVFARIVYAWSPATGSEDEAFPLDSPVDLYFVWEMDKAATEAAFSIKGGPFAPSGTFEWPADNHLRWTPDSLLPAGEVITVELSTSAKSTAGTNIPAPFPFTFQTAMDRDEQWQETVVKSGVHWDPSRVQGKITWTGSDAYVFLNSWESGIGHTYKGYTGTVTDGFVESETFSGDPNPFLLDKKPDGTIILLLGKEPDGSSTKDYLHIASGTPGNLTIENTGIPIVLNGFTALMDDDDIIHVAFLVEKENTWELCYANSSDWSNWTVANNNINHWDYYDSRLHLNHNNQPSVIWRYADADWEGGTLWIAHYNGTSWQTNQIGTHTNYVTIDIASQNSETITLVGVIGEDGAHYHDEKQLALMEFSSQGNIVFKDAITALGDQEYYKCLAGEHDEKIRYIYDDEVGIAYIEETAMAFEYHRLISASRGLRDFYVDDNGYAHILLNKMTDSIREMIYITNRP